MQRLVAQLARQRHDERAKAEDDEVGAGDGGGERAAGALREQHGQVAHERRQRRPCADAEHVLPPLGHQVEELRVDEAERERAERAPGAVAQLAAQRVGAVHADVHARGGEAGGHVDDAQQGGAPQACREEQHDTAEADEEKGQHEPGPPLAVATHVQLLLVVLLLPLVVLLWPPRDQEQQEAEELVRHHQPRAQQQEGGHGVRRGHGHAVGDAAGGGYGDGDGEDRQAEREQEGERRVATREVAAGRVLRRWTRRRGGARGSESEGGRKRQ